MDTILNEIIDTKEIQQFEKAYHEERTRFGKVSNKVKFEYAWALIKSKYSNDIKRGIIHLEDLCQTGELKRDYLYYLIVSNFRIGNYQRSLDCCDEFLKVEPKNRQVIELRKIVKDKLVKEGLKGIAIIGGTVVGIVAGIVGIGMTLSKK